MIQTQRKLLGRNMQHTNPATARHPATCGHEGRHTGIAAHSLLHTQQCDNSLHQGDDCCHIEAQAMACNLARALLLTSMHAMCPVHTWVDLQHLKDTVLATHLR